MRAGFICNRALRFLFAVALVVLPSCTGRPSSPLSPDHSPQTVTSLPVTHTALQKEHLLKSIKDSFMNSLEQLQGKRRDLRNSTRYSVGEKRAHIRKYKKHLEDKNALDRFYERDEAIPGAAVTFMETDTPEEFRGDRWVHRNGVPMYFSLDVPHPDDPFRESFVTSAKLSLFTVHTPALTSSAQQLLHNHQYPSKVKLYQLMKPRDKATKPDRKLISSTELSGRASGWETFDLTDVVTHWFKNPEENYGLEIVPEVTSGIKNGLHIFTRNSNSRQSAPTAKLSDKKIPFLKVETSHRHILGRSKRAPEKYDCRVGDGEKRCCRYPLWVAFSDISWDGWVVAPDGYQAYYCDGACPDRYKPANNFAGIKSILHMINPRSVPGPCCTATKTDSLDLLHYDENENLIVTEYEGMIVQDCKCS